MASIDLHLNGEGCWPELETLPPDRLIDMMGDDGSNAPISLACLPRGTAGGRPSVTLRLDLPDGRVLVTQTTLRLLASAVDAMIARYGDPRR